MSGCLAYLKIVSSDASGPHPKVVFEYDVQRNNGNRSGLSHSVLRDMHSSNKVLSVDPWYSGKHAWRLRGEYVRFLHDDAE